MRFKVKHLRNRITISVSVVVVSTILVAAMLISYIYSNELMKRMVVITEHKMDIIVKNLEEEIGKVIELQNTIQDDDVLQQLIIWSNEDSNNQGKYERAISELLRKYAYENIRVNSILAFDMNKEILDRFYKIEPYNQIIRDFESFNDFIKTNKNSGFSIPTDFPNRQYNNSADTKSTITYFSTYINENNFIQIGYLLLNIKKDYIFREFTKSCQEEFDFGMVIDEMGNVILEVGNVPFTQQELKKVVSENEGDIRNITIQNLNTYIITQSLENYKDWTVVGGISYEAMNEGNKVIGKIILAIVLFSILLVLVTSFFISQHITKPIISVSKAMQELESGNWPSPLEVKSQDELKILVEGFNKMVVDVQVLFQQVKQEQNEKNKYEISNLMLRLELLQSQINPHFIHNTLNAIKYLAIEENAEKLVGVIESFNLLLRSSMSVNTDFISIEEELECVKSFLNIFQVRYDFDIKINIIIHDNIKQIEVPKLILQPIVENSAYHGILPKGTDGKIEIRVTRSDEECIVIEVEDNGLGMSMEQIEKVLIDQSIKQPKTNSVCKKGFNNIGLKNIDDRLNLYYGEAYQLKIKSELDIGTTISFKIPIIPKEGI
ncbi:MAG: hypothetical protein CVV02_07090 [Firmicutes bacterium HGW-Firmicutes-7]|nr:MAG: hypothetical protein CVV02_07090 [Firmicutes bacterium HGW-Firmicutes-7]